MGAPEASSSGRAWLVANAGLSQADVAAALAGHDRALATGEGRLKDGRRTAVTRVVVGGEALCVKEYRQRGLWDLLKTLCRGSRASMAWRAARRLTAAGITTPEALAVVVRVSSRFLVTRFIEGAVALDAVLAERFGGPLPTPELAAKRAMVRELARWLRGVHDRGIYHNDWSAKNILTVEREGRWAFYLLDLDSVTFYKGLTRRRRAKNLGQLGDVTAGVTATDRMRFLLAYADGDAGLTRGRFPRAVVATLRRRARSKARRLARAARRRASG